MSSHSEKWDQRYSQSIFVYGVEPNDFLAANEVFLGKSGSALCLAEGQGRNAVWLAKRGYTATAVDFSAPGLKTASALASEHGVAIETVLSDLADYKIEPASWDVIVAIWCHLPSAIRQPLYQRAVSGLKPDGLFILESYSPDQIPRGTGGPKDPDMLAGVDELQTELAGLEFLIARELERDIREGTLHNGVSSVVQILGRKL